MTIFLFCLTVILTGVCIFLGLSRKKINQEIEDENNKLNQQHSELEKIITEQKKEINNLTKDSIQYKEEVKHLQNTKTNLLQDINNSQEVSRTAFESYQDILEDSYSNVEEEYDILIKNLQESYMNLQKELDFKTEQQKKEVKDEIIKIQEELNKIKSTWAAALEAQRREELLKLEKDSYRIVLSPNEITTIEMLNEIKPRLPEPRILCMLIWQSFYQKKLTALCKKILGANPVCGIYKITNIKNDMCYVGQARNIDERFKEHVKCGLGIDTPVGNKLYQAMKEIGPENFTFEVLEICPPEQLNEKERFYIDLYQAKDFGYNSIAGVKK